MNLRLARSFVLALEGLDGSGKKTIAQKIAEHFRTLFGAVTTWAEPNDATPVGAYIRRVLQHKIPAPADALEFQRLYVVDRLLNILTHLQPALERCEPVVLDRYALSTLAYGMLSGRPAQDFVLLHEAVCGAFMRWPDLTIVVDVPAEECLTRIARRARKTGREPEFFDRLDTMRQVASNYTRLCAMTSGTSSSPNILPGIGRVKMVIGKGTEDEVYERVRGIVDHHLASFLATEEKGVASV